MAEPTKSDQVSDAEATPLEKSALGAGGQETGDDKHMRARGTGRPTSMFWHFDDINAPGGGTFVFTAVIGSDKVNKDSQVAVSITEMLNGRPHLGAARLSVLNVVPGNEGNVIVRGRNEFTNLLPARLNFIIFN